MIREDCIGKLHGCPDCNMAANNNGVSPCAPRPSSCHSRLRGRGDMVHPAFVSFRPFRLRGRCDMGHPGFVPFRPFRLRGRADMRHPAFVPFRPFRFRGRGAMGHPAFFFVEINKAGRQADRHAYLPFHIGVLIPQCFAIWFLTPCRTLLMMRQVLLIPLVRWAGSL